ncbi:MAG TPA: hypothetical protein PKI86_08850, partial [Chitinophagales bacterium]|nr:hypothetical protein [Chitinophagales bacterium]
MMKRIFQIICLIGLFTVAKAQPYGNEWIDYSKTYYKFKLGKTSLYRINYPTLISLGIPASDLKGTAFKLIRNGQQVPLYVTTNNQFGPSDFIEFYGEKNDGKPDSILYKTPAEQPNQLLNLFSDSATFFLTLDPFSINSRIIQQNNDLTAIPDAEKYCYYTTYSYQDLTRQTYGFLRGLPVSPFFPQLYNSDFELGKGFGIG